MRRTILTTIAVILVLDAVFYYGLSGITNYLHNAVNAGFAGGSGAPSFGP
jgi:hypothetical protein